MKQWFATIAAAFLLAGCASGGGNTPGSPNVTLNLTQLYATNGADIFYTRGPINVQLALSVNNPTDRTLTLRRLDLASVGQGAFALRTGSVPMNERIPPGGQTTVTLSTWAQARGGRLTVNEPVTVRGIAQFDDGTGHPFTRVFTQNLNEFGRS